MTDQPASSAPDIRDELMAIYKRDRDRLEVANVALSARLRALEAEKRELAARIAKPASNVASGKSKRETEGD